MHDRTPTTNRMGWKAVVGHQAAGRAALVEEPRAVDPFARWKALRLERLERLQPVVVGGLLAAAIVLGRACWRLRTPWLTLGVGVLSLTVHVGLTCYYHTFLVLTAPLSRARRPIELGLVATAVLGNLAALRFAAFDDRYAALSLLHIVFAAFVALLFARTPAISSLPRPGQGRRRRA